MGARAARRWEIRRSGFLLLFVALLLAELAVGAAGFPSRLPLNARQWNEKATELAAAQKWSEAVEAFSEAIELDPNRSDLLVNRAIARQRLEQWELAEADCTKAIELDPEHTRAFIQRAMTRTELDRDAEAFRDASRAVRMEPENSQAVFIRHWMASRIGRHDLGHVAGETYIGIQGWEDPWSPYVALLNYVSLRRAGWDAAARSALSEAVTWMPAGEWPAAVIRFLRGELTEAGLLSLATDTERALLARYYIGVHHWFDGDAARARELFEAVVSTGDKAFLQTRLAADHLKTFSAGTATAAARASEDPPRE